MSRRSGSRRARGREKVILVFGENFNDTRAIRELIAALCPGIEAYIEIRKTPIILMKQVTGMKLRSKAQQLARILRAERRLRDIECVFIHEDADALEPAHASLARKIEESVAAEGESIHAVVPAWEIESWWLLWPDVLGSCRESWRSPTEFRGMNIGLVADAKEALRNALRTANSNRGAEYKERDSVMIAAAIRSTGVAASPQGLSASYDRFRQSVKVCCEGVT